MCEKPIEDKTLCGCEDCWECNHHSHSPPPMEDNKSQRGRQEGKVMSSNLSLIALLSPHVVRDSLRGWRVTSKVGKEES